MTLSMDEHLNWLAVQYVLGELPMAECAAFEDRLADDPLACEAVMAASRMVLAAQAALAESASDAIGNASVQAENALQTASHGSWMAFTAAVTAAGVLWGVFALQIQNPAGPSPSSTAELVSLWRTGIPTTDAPSDDAETELTDASAEAAVVATPIRDREGSEAGSNARSSESRSLMLAALDDVPHWMLAAVSIESEGEIDGAPEKLQEN
jgi:anti-sigma factor RsiW